MTAEDAYIAMGCPGNEAAATKQNIRKKARAMVAEARAEAGEPAAQSAKRGSAAPAKPAASKRKRGAPDPEPIEQEHDDVADDMDDLAYDDGEQSVCTLELVGLPETVLSTIIAFAVELSFTSYSERQQRISAVRRVAHAWNHEMLQQYATQLWTKLTTPIPRHQFALFSLCSMLVSLCTNWPAVDAAWSTAAAELARSVSTPDRATRTPKAEKLLNNPELADLINDGGVDISLYQYEMALQHSGTSATVARALAGGNATPRTLGSSPHLPTPNQHAVPRIRIGVSEELSAYEKERQANIAQNNEQLVLLGLR